MKPLMAAFWVSVRFLIGRMVHLAADGTTSSAANTDAQILSPRTLLVGDGYGVRASTEVLAEAVAGGQLGILVGLVGEVRAGAVRPEVAPLIPPGMVEGIAQGAVDHGLHRIPLHGLGKGVVED